MCVTDFAGVSLSLFDFCYCTVCTEQHHEMCVSLDLYFIDYFHPNSFFKLLSQQAFRKLVSYEIIWNRLSSKDIWFLLDIHEHSAFLCFLEEGCEDFQLGFLFERKAARGEENVCLLGEGGQLFWFVSLFLNGHKITVL